MWATALPRYFKGKIDHMRFNDSDSNTNTIPHTVCDSNHVVMMMIDDDGDGDGDGDDDDDMLTTM